MLNIFILFIVKFETLFTEETKMNLHHWTMNECMPEFESVYLQNNSIPEPGACVLDGTYPEDWDGPSVFCNRVSLGWAVGGDTVQDFPDDLAYPIGGPDAEFKYFRLEMHFSNPEKIPSCETCYDFLFIRFFIKYNYLLF